jgi:hypothetical protein
MLLIFSKSHNERQTKNPRAASAAAAKNLQRKQSHVTEEMMSVLFWFVQILDVVSFVKRKRKHRGCIRQGGLCNSNRCRSQLNKKS